MKKVILIALAIFFGLGLFMCQMQSDVSGPEKVKALNFDILTTDCNSEPDTTKEIIITVSGNDIIVLHKNAFYNCCSTLWTVVTQDGNIFRIDEFEDEPWCYCMCYRNITTTIYDVPPGTYLIEVYNKYGEYVGGDSVTIIPPDMPMWMESVELGQ